jgi:hypothetical protein
MIRILDYKDAAGLITRKAVRLEEAERIVAPILADVRKRGDQALLEYARKFDGFSGDSVRMPVEGSLTRDMQSAVETAARNIREHARTQIPVEGFIEYPDGRRLGQIVRPLDSRGPLSAAVDSVDDRDSRAGGRGRDDLCGMSKSKRGDSRGRGVAGRDAPVSDGRRAGDRGIGLRN